MKSAQEHQMRSMRNLASASKLLPTDRTKGGMMTRQNSTSISSRFHTLLENVRFPTRRPADEPAYWSRLRAQCVMMIESYWLDKEPLDYYCWYSIRQGADKKTWELIEHLYNLIQKDLDNRSAKYSDRNRTICDFTYAIHLKVDPYRSYLRKNGARFKREIADVLRACELIESSIMDDRVRGLRPTEYA